MRIGWGGGARLVKLVGRQQALRMLGTAERLRARKALDCGLVDRLSTVSESVADATAEFLQPFDAMESGNIYSSSAVSWIAAVVLS